ncbi:helix-turn-helix domain-containing protein [Thermogymnomonas acidicola]|nr:helix-turn-helix domain-containing protein [Thermogymnomonas acidicola]
MKSAYLHGFYSWPRELDADSIGSMFNISKVTALYHLRRAEGKIVRAIVERFT